ncbi:MAG: serine/threonine protein kinase [Holophagales bacterium]|nr:serine/threonine protein kinase [Holophagales bacterium]
MTSFPPSEPTTSFPYQVLQQVGGGSMGMVYRAMEVDLGRTVAIKTLRPSMLEEETEEVRREMRQRFLQEAQAAGRVSHPGITVVYRVGQEGSVPYTVMEWLEGESLEERLRQRGRLPAVESVRLTAELLDALEAAHQAGIVHRDIKPSNVVLLDDGRLKVTDFGIARIQGHDLVKTQAGVVLATPKFASPEQLRGVEVDGRADVFSTGVLLYYMLSGAYPFEGQTFMELATAILQAEPQPLRQWLPDLPADLEAVIRKALVKERQERYRSARQMADDLRSFAERETTAAHLLPERPSPAGRLAQAPANGLDTARMVSVVRHLPRNPGRAVATLVQTWPSSSLTTQGTSALLDRLLDKPLHAPAFAGAAVVGSICLLFENGLLLGAVEVTSGATGDIALARLPASAQPKLFPLPENLPPGTLSVLASLLRLPVLEQANLDSSFVNLPALAQKLGREHFHGFLRLIHGKDWGLVTFVDGEPVITVYSEGWSGIPIDGSWQRWVTEHPVQAQVERRSISPPSIWFRRAFQNLEFEIERVEAEGDSQLNLAGSTSTRLRQLFSSSRSQRLPPGRLAHRLAGSARAAGPAGDGTGVEYEAAPAARFLEWLLRGAPIFFAERDLFSRWKYLAEWIFLIRKATLYHALERPGSRENDVFDLVTRDDKGKVLHIAHRLDSATGDTFAELHERVVAAKLARVKTGDVGGAFYIARRFDDSVLNAYRESLATVSSGSWFGMEESFTGYEGFVRVGPRRGFHLLLVQETDEGFEPLLPSG